MYPLLQIFWLEMTVQHLWNYLDMYAFPMFVLICKVISWVGVSNDLMMIQATSRMVPRLFVPADGQVSSDSSSVKPLKTTT